jgi:DNA-binding response OmpR family regulator
MPRVVVIDDEPAVGELTAYSLSAAGFDVQVANSGASGLKLVLDTLPDAVVCDVRMPDMSGEEVLLNLRLDARTHRIPLVFMSGQCDPRILRLGDGFVEKPFNCKELAATIGRLVASRAGA